MRAEVRADLSDSAYDFQRVVWPALLPLLGGGRLIPVEAAVAQGLAQDFDQLAGIDAWHIVDLPGAMRGVASRVQWGRNWRTFNMRRARPNGTATEYEKRLWALDHAEHGWLLPALTVHAYLTLPRREGELIEAAVVRTVDLLTYIRAHPCSRPRINPHDQVRFDWWGWDELQRAGVKLGLAHGRIAGGETGAALPSETAERATLPWLTAHPFARALQLPLFPQSGAAAGKT